MKTYGEVGAWLHSFLTFALDGSKWFASRPAAIPPDKEPPPPHRYQMDRRGCRPQSPVWLTTGNRIAIPGFFSP
jgi:hypothetical protein